MPMWTTILIVLITFTIGSICDDTYVDKFVEVPVKQWEKMEGKMKVTVNNMKLLLVTQHDDTEVEKLKETVDSVSDPASAEYGNFMSYDEIHTSLLPKTTENGHVLEEWAKTNGLDITRITKYKEFLMVEAPIPTIERVFQTELSQYKHIKTGTTVLRSTSFKLPLDIDRRLGFIDGFSNFPTIREKKRTSSKTTSRSTNAPIIQDVFSSISQFLCFIQLVCADGKNASDSSCANTFRGYQIEIQLIKESIIFNVSVTEANCQSCSTPQFASTCEYFNMNKDQVLCGFYFMENTVVGLYELFTFKIRTKFSNTFSDYATYGSALERTIEITPPVLRSLYNVTDSSTEIVDKKSRQAIVGLSEYLDLSSFDAFESKYGQKFKMIFGKVYGVDYDNQNDDEDETSLDLQYMASMGFGIPTDYISSPNDKYSFLQFFAELALIEANKTNVVPLVYSISYGENEANTGVSMINICETFFMIMSLSGKTVFVSSGDTGISTDNSVCREKFYPQYPASSAYVTSVGATQFVKATGNCHRKLNRTCVEEVVASTSTGSLITSGGGFSNIISSPAYQEQAVRTYLTRTGKQLPPATYFNRTGRAYPDLTLVGHNYIVNDDGTYEDLFDGTSCSSPALAGLFSLMVNQRLKLGKKPFGLLNPLLYSLADSNAAAFYDITKGNNSCNESPTCCQYGFVAEKQWDPVSGLGSINHAKLSALLTAI